MDLERETKRIKIENQKPKVPIDPIEPSDEEIRKQLKALQVEHINEDVQFYKSIIPNITIEIC
jgi:hypothetical protein